MARISYPSTSPYAATPQSSWFIGSYKHRSIPTSGSDETFTITTKYQYRPDLLAHDLYGNAAYWWVFSSRNPGSLRDPVWDFTTGKIIIIPTHSHLKASLG
jgi:hypothetical protein